MLRLQAASCIKLQLTSFQHKINIFQYIQYIQVYIISDLSYGTLHKATAALQASLIIYHLTRTVVHTLQGSYPYVATITIACLRLLPSGSCLFPITTT